MANGNGISYRIVFPIILSLLIGVLGWTGKNVAADTKANTSEIAKLQIKNARWEERFLKLEEDHEEIKYLLRQAIQLPGATGPQ
jgi:cell division protein FtsB